MCGFALSTLFVEKRYVSCARVRSPEMRHLITEYGIIV